MITAQPEQMSTVAGLWRSLSGHVGPRKFFRGVGGRWSPFSNPPPREGAARAGSLFSMSFMHILNLRKAMVGRYTPVRPEMTEGYVPFNASTTAIKTAEVRWLVFEIPSIGPFGGGVWGGGSDPGAMSTPRPLH